MPFTLSPPDDELDFDQSGGTAVATITFGEVTAPEAVSFSMDTSLLPSWMTATLDTTSITTPGTAHITVTVAADAPVGTHSVFCTATDGTQTSDYTLAVKVQVTGPVTAWDQSTAQQTVGTFPLQNVGGTVQGDPSLFNFAGDLYLTWWETVGGTRYGPYVAVWTGSTWSVIGSTFETGNGFKRASPLLASDGTNLYLAYLLESSHHVDAADNSACGTTIDCISFDVRAWKYDGSSWTDLGTLLSGAGGLLPVTNSGGDNPSSGGGSYLLNVSASSDEVGACYVAFYEDGFVANTGSDGCGKCFRHLYVKGFGSSSLGLVDLTSILLQPSPGPPNFDAAPFFYSFQLRGSGANLTLYAQQGDAYQGVFITGGVAHPTVWKVWQPGGFLADLDLATAFGNSFLTLSNFVTSVIEASDDLSGKRLLLTKADYTDSSGNFAGTGGFARMSSVAAPETLSDVDGHVGLNGPMGFAFTHIIQEAANIWAYSNDALHDAFVTQLADRCGIFSWQEIQADDFSGEPYATTAFALVGDALYAVNLSTPAVEELPLVRGAGVCAVFARIWQRF